MHAFLRRLLFGFLFLGVLPCFAQVATGTYAYGSFDNRGFDTINRGNLNVHFSIPIVNKPGRGLPFYYNLAYDSSVWYPVGVSGSQTWTPAPNFGWTVETQVTTGYIGADVQDYVVTCSNGNWGLLDVVGVTYYDQFGVAHAFSGSSDGSTCSDGGGDSDTINPVAMDNSGYQLASVGGDANPGGPIIDRNGNTFAVPVNSTYGVGSATDANGNQITVDNNGNFTDTTGQVALAVSTSAPSPSVPQVLTYKDTNGNPQSVTVTYKAYTVQTNFGCSGIGEYNNTASLVDSITYPDGSAYHFTYEPTPGYSGNVTGRLASVTLPQGGMIAYTYTGGNNGIECTDGSASGLTRSLPSDPANSTYSYARNPSGNTSTTDVTDGGNNHSEYSFVLSSNPTSSVTAQYYETSRAIYQGAAGGTLLGATDTCFNGAPQGCISTLPQLPVTQVDTYTAQNGGAENGSTIAYNQFGLATSETDYDYGSSSGRGAKLRVEQWQYSTSGPMLLEGDLVTDGGGDQASYVTYGYDTTGLVASSGVPQHIAVSGPRGNPTVVEQFTGSTILATTNTYEDTGSLVSSAGPNGTSSYGYDSTFSFQTNAIPPTPSSGVPLPGTAAYDVNTGLPLSTTDPNGATTTISSDAMLRPAQINYPDGGTETFTHYSPNETGDSHTMNSSENTNLRTLLDGYGRLSRTAVNNGQGTHAWYQQDYCYNADGWLQFQSTRYQGDGWGTPQVCSGAGDTYTYDALGRVTQILHADGSARHYLYNGRATEFTDENGVQRITQMDGLGRPAAVCEISSNASMPGSGSPVSCGMDIGGTGFLTTYAYSNGGLTVTVAQGPQTRVFETDGLGRTIMTQEPESGTTNYSYAYNSTGLLVTRQRPQANQTNPSVLTTTTTQYDSVGRVVSMSYNDGTPGKTFLYDTSAQWGESQSDLKGRLSAAGSVMLGNVAGDIFSYDSMGRVIQTGQCFPYGCGDATKDKYVEYSYDWAGNLLYRSDPTAQAIGYTYSPAGEVTSITGPSYAGGPPNLVSNVQNGPFGPASYTFGNGVSTIQTYDTLGRPSTHWVCLNSVQAQCQGGTYLYGYILGYQGTHITDISDSEINQHRIYAYDEFNRVASMSEWGTVQQLYSYTYDRYGNRWAQSALQGGSSSSVSFDQTTNRIAGTGCPNSAEYCYDAAGNLTSDGIHTYTYDAEGNVTQIDTGSSATYYNYDALGRRFRVQDSRGTFDFTFDFAGRRVTEWLESLDFGWESVMYWGSSSTPVAYHGENGTEYFAHQDWQGTERMRTDYTGAVAGSYLYLPFGDGYSATGTMDDDPYHFAGLDKDYPVSSDSGTDHGMFREYSSSTGRWMAPDPYSGSYDISNPQSLNRYSYVLNSPLTFTDPSGLDPSDCSWDNGSGSLVCTFYYSGCGSDYYCTPDGSSPWLQSLLWDAFYGDGSCTWCSGGIARSHSGPPSSAPPNNSNAPSNNLFNCASAAAGNVSAAGGLHALGVGNNGGVGGFLTNALTGNVVSGAIDLFAGSGSMATVAFGGTRLGFPGGATYLDKGIAGATQEAAAAGAHAAISAGGELTTLTGEFSTVGLTGAEYASGVGWFKLGYDALTYAGSLAGCATGVIH